jgi:hypothetical protein
MNVPLTPGTLRARAYKLRVTVIVGLNLLVAGVMLFTVAPFAQPLWYHDFADQRTFWHIPHALNVLSNIPFVLVGLLGLYYRGPIERASVATGGPTDLPRLS